MARRRVVTPDPPDELATCNGLAYALYTPPGEPLGGLVVVHGAGSAKESHYDFARHARRVGFAVIAFDLRGHGESSGELDGGVAEDLLAIAGRLPPGPLALRGSSLGGYLALTVADTVGASCVVAICPASADGLRRGVRAERFDARIDAAGFGRWLAAHDEREAVASLSGALLLMHAEGDEVVPVEQSQALFELATTPTRRLITVPGGHHRSLQHDEEMQAVSLRFVTRAFA